MTRGREPRRPGTPGDVPNRGSDVFLVVVLFSVPPIVSGLLALLLALLAEAMGIQVATSLTMDDAGGIDGVAWGAHRTGVSPTATRS